MYAAFDDINIECIFGKDAEFFHKLTLSAIMTHPNTLKSFLFLILILCFKLLSAQTISFKTKNGQRITVVKGVIALNNNPIYKYQEDAIIYKSKYNRLIEDSTTLLLFLTISGSPNKDRMEGFKILPHQAIKLVDAIASTINDLDDDGFLEFGGADLTEVYPNKDSMYYVPTAFYEIKNGKILPDIALTIDKDIELNGIYLSSWYQLNKDGNCCIVIAKPRKQK